MNQRRSLVKRSQAEHDVIDVLFVVLPDSLLLDLAGPAESFRLANQHLTQAGRPAAFRLRFVGPCTDARSSVGLGLAGIEALPQRLAPTCWIVLLGRLASPGDAALPSHHGEGSRRFWHSTRNWLARVAAPAMEHGSTLLTVCAGALLAADAGLVGTHKITTHHELLDELARLAPAARVQANRVFVDDGCLLSSAGITTGIDLALHLIEQECGAAVAAAVAQTMVIFTRRGPLDEQASPLLAHRNHLHPAVHRVQDAVCAAPEANWTAQRLADAAHVTPRHLARLFNEHVQLSPGDYVAHVRASLARHAMDGGASNAAAARIVGFENTRRLRRTLTRQSAAQPAPTYRRARSN